jgi:hypothetical protein
MERGFNFHHTQHTSIGTNQTFFYSIIPRQKIFMKRKPQEKFLLYQGVHAPQFVPPPHPLTQEIILNKG